jgi:hypothetical protein
MVAPAGLEPASRQTPAPKAGAFTSFATGPQEGLWVLPTGWMRVRSSHPSGPTLGFPDRQVVFLGRLG